jgi:hypothetical protein
MNINDLRRQAEARIQATHRRARDGAQATRVTIYERDTTTDLVRVEYGDGEVRDFRRARPLLPDDAVKTPGAPSKSDGAHPPSAV